MKTTELTADNLFDSGEQDKKANQERTFLQLRSQGNRERVYDHTTLNTRDLV